MNHLLRPVVLGAGLLVALHSASALGQAPSDKATATQLFDLASKAVSAGRYADACPKFAESHRLDPQLGTLLHLADCYEKVGKLATAWASFKEAAELATAKKDPRAQTARAHAAALEPKLSRLTVVVPSGAIAPGLEVRRDDAAVGEAVWGTPIPVDAGPHLIEATAPGKKPWKRTIQVGANGAGEVVTLVALEPAERPEPSGASVSTHPASAAALAPAPELHAQPTGRGNTQRTFGIVAGAAGLVGLGLGVFYGLKSVSKDSDSDSHCPTHDTCDATGIDLYNQAKDAQSVANVGYIAGGALLAGGVILYLTAPRDPEPPKAVTVTPWITAGSGGLLFHHPW